MQGTYSNPDLHGCFKLKYRDDALLNIIMEMKMSNYELYNHDQNVSVMPMIKP